MFGSRKPPRFDISGNAPGKTLLVTAGMDGDEYAGIEAAFLLAEKYRTGGFSGRLIVVPIVNTAGFRAERSENPLDGKFPKDIYPGSRFGSASARLIHALHRNYASKADAWLDMHAGSLTEALTPFLWSPETGVLTADALAKKFYEASGAEYVVTDNTDPFPQANLLAKRGAIYVLAESGQRGERNTEDVERHVVWAERLMETLGMLPKTKQEEPMSPHRLRRVAYIKAPFEGMFRPEDCIGPIGKGVALGRYSRYDGTDTLYCTAPEDGVLLWRKDTMALQPGEILWAFGYA